MLLQPEDHEILATYRKHLKQSLTWFASSANEVN